MLSFIKKYKAFGIGLLLVVPIILLLVNASARETDDIGSSEIILIAVFWWVVISLPIHHFNYIKKNKKTALRIAALIVLFFIALGIDGAMGFPDNPITIFLLLLGFGGLVQLLMPSIISKYWKIIVLYYAPLFLYFVYFRLSADDLETYMEAREDFPVVFFIFPIPLFIGLWIYEQWKSVKTLKVEKAKAELDLLKTQINPHFFFNTLNNLYALTIKNSEKAPEIILKLSDMMRYTIYEGKKDMVSLQDEVAYLTNYIDLHKIRYHKSVSIEFEQDIDESDTVAPLLFIILLENALKHGVESLMQDAFVKMKLVSNDKEIMFSIQNNYDPKELSADKGIGVENLKRRLALIYPELHLFTITDAENVYTAEIKITITKS